MRQHIDPLPGTTSSQVGEQRQSGPQRQNPTPNGSTRSPHQNASTGIPNQQPQGPKNRSRSPDALMVPWEINPSIQGVSNCTARENQDPGQTLTQRWNHQPRKQQARTNVGDHVRHIRMQAEGGENSPPLPALHDSFRGKQPRVPPRFTQFRLQDREQYKQPCDEMERPISAMDPSRRLIREMPTVLCSSPQLGFINP